MCTNSHESCAQNTSCCNSHRGLLIKNVWCQEVWVEVSADCLLIEFPITDWNTTTSWAVPGQLLSAHWCLSLGRTCCSWRQKMSCMHKVLEKTVRANCRAFLWGFLYVFSKYSSECLLRSHRVEVHDFSHNMLHCSSTRVHCGKERGTGYWWRWGYVSDFSGEDEALPFQKWG